MLTDQSFARQVAEYLLEIQAVIIRPDEPFTWSSGRKAPLYCDNRLLLSYPEKRFRVFKKLIAYAHGELGGFDMVAGVATAGIPAATVVAHELGLPLVYVRSAGKKHGRQNQIEGRIITGSRCLVIEDLISTGGSCIKAADALEENGVDIAGVAALFTYELPEAKKNFGDKNYPLITLCNLTVLLEVATEQKYITSGNMDTIHEWMADPEAWSHARG
jgi:orotate phosphoribosyltransferase